MLLCSEEQQQSYLRTKRFFFLEWETKDVVSRVIWGHKKKEVSHVNGGLLSSPVVFFHVVT